MCPPEYAEEVLAVAPAIAALYVRIVVADYVYHSRGAGFRLPVVSVPNEADTVAVPRLDNTEDDVTSLNWAKTAGGLNGIEEAGVSVVDDKLRVRGIHGLIVCDASVFPKCVSVPTALTCAALGLACARDLL